MWEIKGIVIWDVKFFLFVICLRKFFFYVYVLEIWCMKLFIWVIGQVAERQVSTLCMEAQECIVMNKWLELASLMLTSADLIFSKVSDKGANARFCFIFFLKFFSREVLF